MVFVCLFGCYSFSWFPSSVWLPTRLPKRTVAFVSYGSAQCWRSRNKDKEFGRAKEHTREQVRSRCPRRQYRLMEGSRSKHLSFSEIITSFATLARRKARRGAILLTLYPTSNAQSIPKLIYGCEVIKSQAKVWFTVQDSWYLMSEEDWTKKKKKKNETKAAE